MGEIERVEDVGGDDGRDESADERSDRNWNEMLQETRTCTGGCSASTGRQRWWNTATGCSPARWSASWS